MKETITLKVSGKSSCKAVAGSLSHFLKGDDKEAPKNVILSAIGAAAVNQAVKAIGISSGHMGQGGQHLMAGIGFSEVFIDGEEKTVMLFYPTLV